MIENWAIVETDNFGGDYPNEKFVQNLPPLTKMYKAQEIADAINKAVEDTNYPRFWKVVILPYKLQPGFEP